MPDTILGNEISIITEQGEELIAKLMACKGNLLFIRAQLGDGPMPEGMIPHQMTGCNGYVMDASVEGASNPRAGFSVVGIQATSLDVQEGFYVTNVALFALDPETETSVCYAYLALHDRPLWIYSDQCDWTQLTRFLLGVEVSSIPIVNAVINPDVLITFEQMQRYFVDVIRPWTMGYVDSEHNLNYPNYPDKEEHPALQRRIQSVEDMLTEALSQANGAGNTSFYWDLGVTTGWSIDKGVINTAQGRVEC